MAIKLKLKPCGNCGGSGELPADDTGPMLQAHREGANITRLALADAMGISPSYLRDLEYGGGLKNFSPEQVERYIEELDKLIEAAK